MNFQLKMTLEKIEEFQNNPFVTYEEIEQMCFFLRPTEITVAELTAYRLGQTELAERIHNCGIANCGEEYNLVLA